MNAKTLVKLDETRSSAARPLKKRAPSAHNMVEQLEGLIDSVVDKLMPPKGATPQGFVHSRAVYRADAIAMLIAASHHMADPSVKEDRLILALLLEAQKAAAN